MWTRACFAAVLLALAPPSNVPVGEWGGQHVRLSVREDGAALEFDCARGTVAVPLELDRQGRFDVPGTLVREGGPSRPGREEPEHVRYVGETDGSTLDLEVVREDDERLGPFRLKLGDKGRLTKCR